MPITTSLQKEIDTALETTLMFAPKNATLKELASRAYNSNRPTFDQAQETWMLDRIEWMMARKRRAIIPIDAGVEDAQFMLPGFDRIPKRLTMKSGKRVALQNAILSQLREYRAALLIQLTNYRNTLAAKDPAQDPRIIELDRLIELMTPYAKQGKTVTVSQVMAAEKKKQDWKA
jgi:hypothetical protein